MNSSTGNQVAHKPSGNNVDTFLTSSRALAAYGDPVREANMMRFIVPYELRIPSMPQAIYCNRDLASPLLLALTNVHNRGVQREIVTWDGCFCIRKKRTSQSLSLHSWGVAIDINAAWNPQGKSSSQNPILVQCFKDAGFDWGGDWDIPDAMHFQINTLAIGAPHAKLT
jgi:hypothetical protein